MRLINWKRNNKIAIRNFDEAVDFHDIVKVLLVRMLRRKHPNSYKVPIYTELKDDELDGSFPDIWMSDEKKDIYVWELQEKITKNWTERTIEKYEAVNLIIVPLKNLNKRSLGKLKKDLEVYVI